MKTRNLLIALIGFFPASIMAQSDFVIEAVYLSCDSTIFIHLVNNTDKPMRIRNSFLDIGSGSHVQFILKDKAGKEITVYDAVFYEGVNYQRFVDISPRSSKTIRYPLQFLVPSSRNVSEIYSVDASCFISYSIPEKNIYENIHKVLTINTKQDLMIYPGYDRYAKRMIITLNNASDHEISVRNPSSAVKFELLNQQGAKFATRSYPFIIKGSGAPSVIKIAPKSSVILEYSFSQIAAGLADPSQVISVEAHFSAYYDIPAKNVTNAFSGRTYTFDAK
ncbi:hypothetical protein SAMN05216365_10223 [Porphyromonadaceae bacterium NLAE-zl-C104]|nr:hypothetical protein SAMN05216331_11814 [Porphyromonadaceae bacterium KH3R12]SFS31819.1 hypothetical protein SAMN05216365_10223 [Porphyromonadaceae bacterium NLAE-zl-C104]